MAESETIAPEPQTIITPPRILIVDLEEKQMSEKQPTAGIYSAPSGFTKKDKLTSRDF